MGGVIQRRLRVIFSFNAVMKCFKITAFYENGSNEHLLSLGQLYFSLQVLIVGVVIF